VVGIYLWEAELWVNELVPTHQRDAQLGGDHLAARLDAHVISLTCRPGKYLLIGCVLRPSGQQGMPVSAMTSCGQPECLHRFPQLQAAKLSDFKVTQFATIRATYLAHVHTGSHVSHSER